MMPFFAHWRGRSDRMTPEKTTPAVAEDDCVAVTSGMLVRLLIPLDASRRGPARTGRNIVIGRIAGHRPVRSMRPSLRETGTLQMTNGQSFDPEGVAVIIPALDEEEALPLVLADLGRLALLETTVVVDNGSRD